MTRYLDREKARTLRSKGKSYSEIKSVLGISKGTLSEWLKDMPLSSEQIRLLRDLNPKRIENFRKTMRLKKERQLQAAYEKAKQDIGRLSSRDSFILGLGLYWAEGTKAAKGKVEIANTDPYIVKAFLNWLKSNHVPTPSIAIRLQLYVDMDIKNEVGYWSGILGIPASQFRKPSIKTSRLSGLSRKQGHGHGTCNLIFDNTSMSEYISMALKRLRELQSRP